MQDYELLGDLHRKQGKDQEAVAAYQKALEQKPEPARATKIQRKLAQVYLEQGKDADAQRVLDAIRQLLRSTPESSTKPAEAARPLLPAKLVISAPKRLLVQVGSGHLSPDAFQKAATVDFVNFPPEPK
jgi:tetratricopeptide (TPR) repeat protein